MKQYEITLDIINKQHEIIKLQLELSDAQKQLENMEAIRDIIESSPVAPIRCNCRCRYCCGCK